MMRDVVDVISILEALEEDAEFKDNVAIQAEQVGDYEKANLLRAEAKGIRESVKEVKSVL